MKRRPALALCLIAAALLASAQDSAPKASAIAGTVVKEPGSEPLKKVLVQVVAEDQKNGGNYTTTTDADGHFRIDNVVSGRYRIFFERTGFVGVNSRGAKTETNVLTVQAGQSLEDLLFRMLPTAVISGRVTDEDGDPLSEVRVIAQKKRPGKNAREGVATVGTNDLGEFRLSGLFPGQYWIVAIPPPDFRDYEQPKKTPSPGTSTEDQPDMRYLTTYYPGTFDAIQASTVTLKAGDEMPVNLVLAPAPAYKIRGFVTGIPSNQKVSVEVFSKAGDSIHAAEVGPDGQFEVRGLGPGSYMIGASSGSDAQLLTARQSISIVAADVEGVRLTPVPSFTLSGHLRADDRTVGELTQFTANLRPADQLEDPGVFMGSEFFGTNAPVDRLGNLEWKNVNPGNYIVQIYGGGSHGFYLKSVTLGGRDVATGFSASGPATLELQVSTRGGIIAGTVVEKEKDVDDDHPVPNATVVAVPEEKFRKLPDRSFVGSTDQHGTFTMRDVAPGNYTLFAWQDLEDEVWRDPDFLKSQESNGTSVRVEEGLKQKIQLTVSPVPEEWR
jgi:hypothetical protein